MNYQSIVFEGGGIRGISYIGALKYLDEIDLIKNIKNFAGTSSGSQVAALLAIGYSISELEEIMKSLPVDEIKDSSCSYCFNFYNFFKSYGYYNGEFLLNYLEDLIYNKCKKKNFTFLNLWNTKGVHLKVTGTCLEKKNLQIFDYLNTPNMSISKALQISSCIPFFFKPVMYNNYSYVDGGCLRNFPVNIFNEKEGKTIAIELISENEFNDEVIDSFKSYALSIVNTIHSAVNKIDINSEIIQHIQINTGNVTAIDFDIDNNEKKNLINNGYNATKIAFNKLN